MADSTTTLGFVQPEVGSSVDTWGGKLNTDWTLADVLLQRLVGTTTTHLLAFNVNAVSTTTTRTVTWIDEAITVVGATNTQTLTNKTLTAPTLTNAVVGTQTSGSNTTLAASTAFVGWQKIGTNILTGATSTAFTGISASINHLALQFEVATGTNNADVFMRTYGADGAIDTGASDYFSMAEVISSSLATPVVSILTSSLFNIAGSVTAGTVGLSANVSANNIQAATRTKFFIHSQFQNTSSEVVLIDGVGIRQEADRITGIQIGITAGVMTGVATLLGSV